MSTDHLLTVAVAWTGGDRRGCATIGSRHRLHRIYPPRGGGAAPCALEATGAEIADAERTGELRARRALSTDVEVALELRAKRTNIVRPP